MCQRFRSSRSTHCCGVSRGLCRRREGGGDDILQSVPREKRRLPVTTESPVSDAIGADDGSSFCAVQFGHASAFPHGLPGEQRLAEGDIVLIDTGCRVQGYNSDITRTYVFGAPNAEQRRVWEVEKRAQAAAFAAVKPGVTCEEIDAVARKVLEAAGFGPDYALPGLPHRTGHGIGLAIHEAPYLVRGDKTRLQPGMCFSNEPMIVLPEVFGVRLEDHFYVTEDGAAWFTEPQTSIDQPFAKKN